MDVDLGVGHRDDIDFSALRLLLEKGSLTHAHADTHLIAAHVVEGGLSFSPFLVDKNVEIDVNIAA